MKRLRRMGLGGTIAILALGAYAAGAQAQSGEMGVPAHPETGGGLDRFGGIADRFTVRGGPFFADHATRARIDSESLGIGTLVDLESDLGLETRTRDARVDAALRLGRRHTLRGGYLRLSRGAAVQLQRRIQWGDEVFDLDVGVESAIELILVPISYRFSLIKSDRLDLGLSAGVFAAFLDARLDAPSASVEESESLGAPLPVLGADVDIALAPGLFLLAGAELFSLSIEEIDGSWSEIRSGIEYFPLRNIGIGAAYRHVSVQVDGTGTLGAVSGTDVFLDYRLRGPQLFVTLSM